jgi:membrane dipeptidase
MKSKYLDISSQTEQLINESLMWDNHACMPLRADDTSFLPQLQQFGDAGVDIVSLNVGFDAVAWNNTPLMLASFRDWIKQHSDDYILVDNITAIQKAKAEGKLGITFDIEGAGALNGQLDMIEKYYELGVRWMLMAYNQNNAVGGGCQDDDRGLTDFGRDVLDEMTRAGMVICCSHTGFKTTMEVMEYVNQPVIFSHSNPSAMWKHKRNINDEAIKACAETGGVIGLNGIGIFLGNNDASVENIVRHIDYVVQLVGPDYVGIGLDYVFDQQEVTDFVKDNPHIFPPEDGYADGIAMLSPTTFPAIVQSLLDLGYVDKDVKKIMGINHLRIAEKIWR